MGRKQVCERPNMPPKKSDRETKSILQWSQKVYLVPLPADYPYFRFRYVYTLLISKMSWWIVYPRSGGHKK